MRTVRSQAPKAVATASGLPQIDDPPHDLASTARREFCILVDVHPGLAARFADRISSPISFRDRSRMDNLLRDHV